MNIMFKNTHNIESNKSPKFLPPQKRATLSFNNSPSFKGVTVSEAVKIFEREVGKSASEHLDKTIEKITSAQNPLVKRVQGDGLEFDKDTVGKRLYRAIVDPLIYLPIDLANSTLNLIKRIPGFRNSKFIDNLLKTGPLYDRSKALENFSHTMAVQHYFDILNNQKEGKYNILREATKRFKLGQTEYTVKGERSLTRLVTGILPAFFLANDAYNLSMYVNNNKDLAKKEKKRRFYQEISRVAVTAAATFITLGYFSKKVSSSPKIATGVIAGLTFASELIGRMLVGTPVYPIGKDSAKEYKKLQKKDKIKNDNKNTDSSQQVNEKKKPKSNYALKVLGGMVLAGFLIEKHQSIKPVRKFVNNLTSKYKELFAKDYTISRKEFDEIVTKLRQNGFEKIAKSYEKARDKIIEEGNLTAKEQIRFDREFNNQSEQFMPDGIILDEKKFKKAQENARKGVISNDVVNACHFKTKDNDIININGDLNKLFKEGTNVSKPKDTIFNIILGFPIRFAWEVLNMPYLYIAKPLIEIPIKGRKLLEGKEIASSDKEIFRKSIEFLRKHIKDTDFKEKINRNIIEGFDNVNKSNISSAELGGSAKVAVSTVTSGFLVLDNYNMVMVDTEGKDKDLAKQKAKERTLQRIVRIAYGACFIKFFNGLFRSQYNSSLLGAQTVNTANTLITETLERTSVGLPLHEATREEIIQTDNESLNATGLKGAYFRFMSKITGKKPLSEKASTK